ncbi:hypothetical protein KC349_g70 [Hortaea werneckii]|nr:hypothetical protein KC349_g70 [Hortaea werneckii]
MLVVETHSLDELIVILVLAWVHCLHEFEYVVDACLVAYFDDVVFEMRMSSWSFARSVGSCMREKCACNNTNALKWGLSKLTSASLTGTRS